MNKRISAVALALAACAHFPPAAAQSVAAEVAEPARFSVEVVGSGPDVILIPGLATPREVWRPTADALKDRYRVHLVQIRGFGEPAGANAQGPVLAPFVAELAAYIREQRLTKPAVVGHSLGGLAALMLATDQPDLPGGVMIVDALPFYGVLTARPGMSVTAESIEPQAKMLRDQMIGTYGQPVDPRTAEATAASQALMPEARAAVAQWVASADPRVTGQLAYDDLTADMRERIAGISVPVTVVYPWNETYPTQAQADGFYQGEYASLPGTRFVPIGPAGHFIMLDRPAAMRETIEAFLARAAQSAR
jgi:pimeloyl-ACP methyl ester carboxylesterase